MISYEQTSQWKDYCILMQEHPEAFRNTGNIDIVTDIRQVTAFVEKIGKRSVSFIEVNTACG